MLLSDVNHRAKNSLAVAASLLAIQGRRQPDRAVRALFEEAQDRLNAMARVTTCSANRRASDALILQPTSRTSVKLSVWVFRQSRPGIEYEAAAVPT